MEMLHGGTRVSNLVQKPFALRYTKSEELRLPSPGEEAELMGLEYQWIGVRLLPLNIGGAIKTQVAQIRNEDVYRRHKAANRTHHPRVKDLSILPAVDVTQRESIGRKAFGIGSRFMPLQILKPMPHNWAPALRGAGYRSPSATMFQERIDQKGFGSKRKSRSLWQQDIDTAGFHPNRYY